MSADNQDWWARFFRGPWEPTQMAGYPPEQTRAEVDFLVSALELQPGQSVLDVPCGQGRHAIELAVRGFDARGLDFNPNALARAQAEAQRRGASVAFVEGDMRALGMSNAVDAAFSFYSSFGYFSDEDNARVLASVYEALKPGGRFLVDTYVSEALLPRFKERDWRWEGEGASRRRVLEELSWDMESGRINSKWTFIDGQAVQEAWTSLRIYSYLELRSLFRAAGFGKLHGYQTGSQAPFKLGSPRLSLVAWK